MVERCKERFELLRPLLVPLVLYIGLLVMASTWMRELASTPWRYAVALAPLVPGAFLALGIVRAIRHLDELDRRILLEGLAVSSAMTLILAVSLGLLGLAGLSQPNALYIALFMAAAWLVGKLLVARKYR